MPAITFFVFLGVQWWAAWYPGAEPGGGGYVAQRIFSARTERDGVLATLWFNVAMYALRPWPWILVALASLILYPGLEDPATGYVRTIVDLLPSPMKGLLIASFMAAYMSTISTQLNWGASYLVNDIYLRFLRPDASERRRVAVSRGATVGLFALSALVTANLSTSRVRGGSCSRWAPAPGSSTSSAGTGGGSTPGRRSARWWRRWSSPPAFSGGRVRLQRPTDFAWLMLFTVGLSTAVWLASPILPLRCPRRS
jgi:solute:Na+ symporter, SSS family